MSAYAVITFADGTKCYSGPTCMRHAGKQRLSAGFSEISLSEKLDELDNIANNPLMKQTPSEIDNVLAGIYGEYHKKMDEISNIDRSIKSYKERMNPEHRWYNKYDQERNEKSLARQEESKLKLEVEAKAILDEADPLNTEFTRRGGWTRAFLVDNTNGHVHKNRHCSTCFPTTRYTWLPDYSGSDENKIVEDAGEAACTVCYPSAPVDGLKRKSLIEAPDKKIAREAREAAKTERDRKNTEKGITNPDGSEVRLVGRYGDTIKAARTAEISAVDALVMLKVAKAKINEYYSSTEAVETHTANYEILINALANKFGRSREEQEAILEEKANKKLKKDWSV